MKLEIKHIQGYLLHDLTCLLQSCDNSQEPNIKTINQLHVSAFPKVESVGFLTHSYILELDRIKPILSSLEDLKLDKYFDMYMDLCEEMETLSCEYLLESLINKTSYSIGIHRMEILENWMHRNKFDWRYDLIKNGLAINYNTLSK